MKFLKAAIASVASLAIAAKGQSIVDVASGAADFETLVSLVSAVEPVAEALSGDGEFTVFAPTNAAFTALFQVADLQENLGASYNNDLLEAVLKYHVLDGKVEAGDLSASQTVATLLGSAQTLTITTTDGNKIQTTSDGVATITAVDTQASNGVIHTIDSVLVPGDVLPTGYIADIPPAADTGILAEALTAAGLLDVFKGPSPTGFTVFAPTDAAFVTALGALGLTKAELFADVPLLTKILKYHVVGVPKDADAVIAESSLETITDDKQKLTVEERDAGVFINNAQVTVPNVRAWNGVVHVIDAVLVPADSIVELASKVADFSTLVSLVSAVEPIAQALSGAGTFTVFAPTNEAFNKMFEQEGLQDNLVASYNNDLLEAVLKYHVLDTKVLSTDLSASQTVATLLGSEQTLTITTTDGNKIETTSGGVAAITAVDTEASNGVIHTIDTVLGPVNVLPTGYIADIPPAAETGILAEALTAAGLLDVFKGPSPTGFTVFAPTDAAFVAALDALGLTKAELFADVPLLTKILKYHVVGVPKDAAAVSAETSLETITDDKQKLTVEVRDAGVFINNAQVTVPNVRAWNGVVHVIDAVLVPNLPTSSPTASPTVSSSGKLTVALFAVPAILLQLF